MKKHLLMLLGALIALPTMARDFEYTYEGQTITYTVIDEDAKTVMTKQGDDWEPGNYVSGNLILPSEVYDGGKQYTLTEIGACAFIGCYELTSVTIPNSVTTIGGYAFRNCRGLTSFTIPNSVTSIGVYAFESCSGLTSVSIGNSVTSIGGYAFRNCRGLTSFTIPNSVTSIGERAFYDCRGLTSVSIGNSVTSIGESAFTYCTGLTSVTIPNSVTEIGDGAFRNCSGLTSVTIPNSVTTIGSSAFSYCSGLTSVTIPNSVTTISGNAFEYCSGLTSVTIPNSVTEISNYAFSRCSNLTSVTIPNSVTTIGNCAFYYCSGLTSVIIPPSVTTIGWSAFSGCSGLKKSAHPNTIEKPFSNGYSIAYNPNEALLEDGWIYGPEKKEIIFAPLNIEGEYAIPETVESIGYAAFAHCSGLISVEIPNSVTSIGDETIYECSGLISITSYALTPPTCYHDITDNYDITLYVPDKAVDAYKSARYWKNFTNLIGFDTSKNITVNGLNYIIDVIDHTAVVTYAEQNSLSNYEGMQSVIIPETVEYESETYTVVGIGDEAFNNCWGLKAVALPSTLETIGKLAFGYCTSLRSVTIPDEVTVIDTEAFTGCSALASVTIGNSVETIGDYAFFGCTGLDTLHVPESVTTIGENAFMGIHWINEVHAKSETPAEAPVSAFSTNAYKNATLVVPDGAIDTYKAHPTWTNFMAIREAGNLPTKIEVVDGAIVVKGAEDVRIYNTSGAQVYSGGAGRVELPAGIYLVATDSLTKKVKI